MSDAFHEIHIHSGNVPATVSLHEPGEPIIDMHWHEELELIASLDSRISITRGSQHYTLEENDCTIINSMQPHRGVPMLDYEKSGISINISPAFLESFCPNFSHVQFYLGDKPEIRKQISELMQQLYTVYRQKDPYYELEANFLLYRIVHILFRHCQLDQATPQQPSTEKYKQRYRKIASYLSKHYREPITLSDLAAHVHISREHLSREFKTYFGEGFREHLTCIRLSNAQKDLRDTDMPLSEIALKHGFADLRSYNKAFRSSEGMSPAQYRRKHRQHRDHP